ncbi:uncharacterized protein [Coffea arabica]|uniref:NAC domain-containing protein n=1 Tax=Coffea arabica TaxID=13443 RepID=A0A6P6X3R1_COFAR|nr:NAC domain-containing protein 55-like [Coffea arabica]
MEMDQQNQPIREVFGTSPNTIQSLPPPFNELQQEKPSLLPTSSTELQQEEPLLWAASSSNASSNNDGVNEFFDEEEEFIDHAFFESFPPGYRFCPKDGELIVFYLRKKIAKDELPRNQIRHVNLYQHSPDKISERYPPIGEKEWYFFTPRNRKYRNGERPNRAAGTGYWKATGADKPVNHDGSLVGFRKALVFYEGKPPKGVKTNWIMHEYRVKEPPRKRSNTMDMRLDDFVLCRIYKKTAKSFKSRPRNEDSEYLDQNDYPTPQGNERLDQNNAYPLDMDMDNKNDLGGLDRELNAFEASSGLVQSEYHIGLHEISNVMGTSLLADSVKCFNNNFQIPFNCGAKPVNYKGIVYPMENALMPKYLREAPDVKPRKAMWNITKDYETFNLSPEIDFGTSIYFPDLDNLMNNPPSNSCFENSNNPFDSPPMPKRS